MADQANEKIVIGASAQACFDVICDFDAYPEWATDVKSVSVDRHDGDGRGGMVSFRAAAMGRSANYSLEYFYGTDPLRVAWRLVTGDVIRRLDGRYVFNPLDDNQTEVDYALEVELAMPVPGFVKRRAETRIIRTALDDLRRRVEGTLVS